MFRLKAIADQAMASFGLIGTEEQPPPNRYAYVRWRRTPKPKALLFSNVSCGHLANPQDNARVPSAQWLHTIHAAIMIKQG